MKSPPSSETTKIGVVGCGAVSGYGHLPAINESADFELVGIADTDPLRLKKAREQYGVEHAVADYRELLEIPGLDALVVATHLQTHFEITIEALKKRLHVLCEKPMAATVDECRKMVDAAESQKRVLAINFNTRCGAIYRRIKQLIDEDAVGEVRVVRIILNWSCHQWKPPERLEHFMADGGPIVDSAVHFFDGVRWFTGQEFSRIDASGLVLPPYEHPQHAIASCLLDDGCIALVEAGWVYTKKTKDAGSFFQLTVIGDDGTIEYETNTKTLHVWTDSETRQEPMQDTGKHFEVAYGMFAEGIRGGACGDLATGYDGLKATEAAFAALASTKRV